MVRFLFEFQSIGNRFLSKPTVLRFVAAVDSGQRAIIFDQLNGGIQPDVITEGSHFYIPFIQRPILYDVRMRPRSVSSVTGTKDLQQVQVTMRVLSRPVEEKLAVIHKELGVDYDERVLPSIGNEVLKAVIAQYDAESLLTHRDKVSKEIREGMSQRAAEFHIRLDDVSITHLQFSTEFTHAIESKQVAQQDSERSKFIVLKSEQERQAAIIRATSEAQAAELISQAMRKSGSALIEIRRFEAAQEIAENLSKNRNVTYMPGGANMMMNMSQSKTQQL
jgi:prohibitin 1